MSEAATQHEGSAFVRRDIVPAAAPPAAATGIAGWVRMRLFGTVINALFTLAAVYLLWLVIPPLIRFLFVDAVWHGASRDDCVRQQAGHQPGACWPFIAAKFNQLIYGFYPRDQQWRVDIVFALAAVLLVPLLMPAAPMKRANAVAFFGIFPVLAYVLLLGGVAGLPHVGTGSWGGLLVTLVLAVTGIVTSLPFGVLLALGRRSQLPAIRLVSTLFIEFWRGVPLITVLFFATYVLPLFFPPGWTVDGLLRALIGLSLFAAAYMAEVVRGGLQAIPRGQYEGAMALGLGYWRTMGLVVLPQALRLVIPGIVNNFIGLFKDTTLLLIVSIFDFLGQLRSAFADPNWATPVTLFTGFAFAGMVYFLFCFGMSRYSLFLERRLETSAPRRG